MSLRSGRVARALAVTLLLAFTPGVVACGKKDRSSSNCDETEDTGKKKGKDQEKSADPVVTYLETINKHLRQKTFANAIDVPPQPHVDGTMTVKRAFLTEADAKEYSNEPIARPTTGTIGPGRMQSGVGQYYSSVDWNPARREVAVLELCFMNFEKAGDDKGWNTSEVVGPYWKKLTSDKSKALIPRTFAGVLSGMMTKQLISRPENSFIPIEEFPAAPLEGALFNEKGSFPCVRVVSPEARKDKAFLSSVIEKGNWPDLEKKL